MSIGEEAFESILAAAKAGADWAWAALYRELAGPVTGYLASRGAAEPEDVASEVFLKVASGIHSFEGDKAAFRSWVFVIAHRRLIDERRYRGRRPDLTELPADTSPDNEGGNVESEAVDRLVTRELREAFDELTEGQRDVLALRMIAGLTLKQTAEIMGKRTNAIKALQHRAVNALADRLDLEDVTL